MEQTQTLDMIEEIKNFDMLECEKSQEFKDSDFDSLEKSFKSGCLVMVPETEIVGFTMKKYVDTMLKKYDERSDIEPYVEATLDEVMEDFKDYEDCFDNLEEFCKKIYGGYIEGTNVMSTINYNTEWSYCRVINTYDATKYDDIEFPIKVKSIVDLNGILHKKNSDDNSDWNLRKKELINKHNENNNLFLVYVEYF